MSSLSVATTNSSDDAAIEGATDSVADRKLQRVTVVVPCFNEHESVDHLADHLADFESSVIDLYDVEFMLVDDGSSDATAETLHDIFGDRSNYRIIRHERNQGVAAAIMTGIRHARTEIACSIDSDCTYRLSQLTKMIPLLDEDISMVTASPYHPDGEVVSVPAWRLALSRCASTLYRTTMRSKLYCYTSCCRVYRRDAMLNINLRREGFVGIAELIWQLDKRGGRVVESPAVLSVRQFGTSKMRTLRATTRHLRLMGRVLLWRLSGATRSQRDPQPAQDRQPAAASAKS